MKRVPREKLIQELEAVRRGLTAKEVIDQSNCFVFQEGRVATFNDEIAYFHSTCLDVECAVRAQSLLDILHKLKEDELMVEIGENELLIKLKGRKMGVTLEKEVLLPVNSVEKPDEWLTLPDDFDEALKVALDCASDDEANFQATCIHITPDWIEACDDVRAARYAIQIGLEKPLLIRSGALKGFTDMGFTSVCQTENWVHFENGGGLVASCRHYAEEYPDLSKILEIEGKDVRLPKGLVEAADKAEVFSSENAGENRVTVEIRTGKVKIKGEGVTGWYTELKQMKSYKGPDLKFLINPQQLVSLIKKYDTCTVSDTRLKIKGSKFEYITALGTPDKKQ